MKGWQTYDTPNRQKQNASSAYIKANSVTGNHLSSAHGHYLLAMVMLAPTRCSLRLGKSDSSASMHTSGMATSLVRFIFVCRMPVPMLEQLLLKACGVLIQFDVAKRCSD